MSPYQVNWSKTFILRNLLGDNSRILPLRMQINCNLLANVKVSPNKKLGQQTETDAH